MKPFDPAAQPSRPEFDVHLTENVPVPMRDAVRLATDVYRPARDGRSLGDRRPVLLHRTPYNKAETEATSGECNTVFHEQGRESRVVLPIVPAGRPTPTAWSRGASGAAC
jgi:predicted acyl esterase